MADTVKNVAARTGDNPVVRSGARIGYAASGILHLVIAWIAVTIAWSGASTSADQNGALGTLAATPVGGFLLWTLVVGFGLLALWYVADAFLQHGAGDRLKSVGKAVLYGVLAWTAGVVLRGAGSNGGNQAASASATLMKQPFGRGLVVAVGVAIVGVGLYHVVKGWRRRFLRDLVEHPGRWAVLAGRIGYVTKGVALGLVGWFFVQAGMTSDPAKAQGLDGALRSVLKLPAGPWLLTVVAIGLAAYGIYSFARARYARL
ncbi:DUF1206 domain-containing protein [Cellulomonas sp. URHD0024]|uniref:DUF1206 domain-containing protein n=1 Tax=Cellulomonas sp. URHD0024 TaxID=1302620 RepID=UPI0003FA8162|nr:DUF1206 domain-containing protein [Cellulomonas sp. URHD0024]